MHIYGALSLTRQEIQSLGLFLTGQSYLLDSLKTKLIEYYGDEIPYDGAVIYEDDLDLWLFDRLTYEFESEYSEFRRIK